jgi:hypothetical protein
MADKTTNIESVHNSAAPVCKRLTGGASLSIYPCLSYQKDTVFRSFD